MIHIAYVCADRGVPLDGHGGSSVHVRELVGALLQRGAKVTLFAANPIPTRGRRTLGFPTVDITGDPTLLALRTSMGKELRVHGQPAVRGSEIYDLLLNQSLAEALTRCRRRIDLVYERYSLWSFAGLQIARRLRVPYFLEVNAPLLAQQQDYRELDLQDAARAIETHLFSSADCICVTSPALVDYVHSRGASRRRIRVIPCGASPAILATRRPASKNDDAEFVVGFLGSLKPWHGVELLLEAFARLAAISPRYRLLVVGEGPLLSEIESLCAARNLSSRVRLVGSIQHTDVPDFLAQMDVGVAAYPPLSPFYFSPLKVWEYAAAGVPIIASQSGELPRLFPHRSAALLHPPGKVGKIVKHVENIRHDPDLGRRLARRARGVAKQHTWDRLAARLLSLAIRAIASKGGDRDPLG